MRQIQDKTPQTLTTIEQQPLNMTMTAPAQRATVAVKRRGRGKAQPMATCQVLDTIEEVNEDSQMYPDLDIGETESGAADLCERSNRLLQKICTKICRCGQAFN